MARKLGDEVDRNVLICLGILVGILLLVLLFFVQYKGVTGHALDVGDSSAVSRIFSGGEAGENITVNLVVFIDEGFGHKAYVVEEDVPSDLVIVNGGDATVSGNVLRWGVINESGVSSVNLSYVVRANEIGTYSFNGSYGIDGMDSEEIIVGEDVLSISSEVVYCSLDSANWSADSVVNGSLVNLNLVGEDCEGEQFNFSIYEDDGMDDDYVTSFVGTYPSGSWTALWMEDGVGDPEFYFVASLVENESVSMTSGLLSVSESGCSPSLVNTSWSEWSNETCQVNNTLIRSRSLIQYDENSCGGVNVSYFENEEIFCDYCSYSISNSSWGGWVNLECLVNDKLNQSRSLVEYDANYGTCYSVTGLVSDLWNEGENKTYVEYQAVEDCDFCSPVMVNSSGSGWIDLEVCQVSDSFTQSLSFVEYDANDCGEVSNVTHVEYREVACDYCTPNLVNSSWGDWFNVETCQDGFLMQNRSLTESDSNGCGETVDKVYFENREITCDVDDADVDDDGVVSTVELVSYVEKWESGDVSIGEVISAITLWLS